MTPISPPLKYPDLDGKIRSFLKAHKGRWKDKNIPEADGKILFDLIVQKDYTQALEIGTSTGHSGIWIAWALSKTGGTLVTIENDPTRFMQALENFEKAGVSALIDARRADAQMIIPKLAGPFDFIFCDADKAGYKSYLQGSLPLLQSGGCFTAHNVCDTHMEGIQEFLDYLYSLSDLVTRLEKSSGSGISISYKK